MNIKIFSIDEIHLIGFKRAFYRDSVWFLLSLAGFFYYLIISIRGSQPPEELNNKYSDYLTIVSLIWLTIELITMVTNSKRRALHDYLANSVVISLDS